MDIIGKRKLYFLISLLVMIPGIVSMVLWGFNLSIDFTGGSRLVLAFAKPVEQSTVTKIREVFENQEIAIATIQRSNNRVIIRAHPIPSEKDKPVVAALQDELGKFQQEEFSTIGPVIGSETTLKAMYAIAISSVLIVLYIAWSFRHVPKPASSWRFGLCAIAALLHDVLVLFGTFSLLGHFLNVELDSLFITAALTIIGFSVHDTIVVFDRIRENLKRMGSLSFEAVVNDSILQTLGRSLNTSITVLLVLLALLLFGGESIRWFVVALLIGITSGTYSSIFNAAPLLVVWENWSRRKKVVE